MELNETVTPRRRQTRSSIYQYLYRSKGFCSKQGIAHDLDLSLPTVYQNLSELMDAGLVRFSGEQRSTGGRRANGLDIVPDAGIAIGISVTDRGIYTSAVDLRLHELCSSFTDTDSIESFIGFEDFFARRLEKFIDENGIDRSKLLGVGVGIPAVFTPDGEGIILAPTLHMHDIGFKTLRDAIPYPLKIQNDASCGGHMELFMNTKNVESGNMLYLSLENGVGGSIISAGKPYRGDHQRSGEFGHMCIVPGGRPCQCGKRGCLEAYCSASRITSLEISLDEFFFEKLGKGLREYDELWDDMLRHLAVGINTLNMIGDCNVVLGGFLSEYLEPWMPLLKKYVGDGNPFDDSGDFLRLTQLGRHSVALGAALYFIEGFTDSI